MPCLSPTLAGAVAGVLCEEEEQEEVQGRCGKVEESVYEDCVDVS